MNIILVHTNNKWYARGWTLFTIFCFWNTRWNIIGIFVGLYIIDWFQLSVLQRYVNICNSLCAVIIDFHYNSNFEAIIVQLNMFVETQSSNNVIESYLKRSLPYHLFSYFLSESSDENNYLIRFVLYPEV